MISFSSFTEQLCVYSYEVIERKLDRLDRFICAVQKVIDCESVSLIHVGRARYGMKHWANDNIGIDDRQIKGGLVVLHELPGSFLGQLLGRVISKYCIIVLECVFCCNLQDLSKPLNEYKG